MPRYVLIAGVNGAGKSTFYHSLRDIQKLPRINTDEIIQTFGDWRNTTDVMKAGRIAVKQIHQYLKEGISFNQETTLCGKSTLHNILEAKKRGYLIELHYVGVDTVEIAKERVQKRVLNGGHGIPNEDIERRYETSFKHMLQILDKCDLAVFYDNSIYFRRFAIFKNGQIMRKSSTVPNWYKKYFNL